MKEFKDKVAVITGAGSGMGKAFAEAFGDAGCKLVLADVEEPALKAVQQDLTEKGISAISVVTDVSKEADMDNLGKTAFEEYGQVNLLFNNAGVGIGGPLVDAKLEDWEWVLGVNLWGVIHGLRVFLPHLTEHGDGHIINTASVAGLLSYSSMGIYNVTKHAVVTISETLFHELRDMDSTLGISVLCPGIVKTKILDSERNRPETFKSPIIEPDPLPEDEARRDYIHSVYERGLDPEVVAEQVKTAILENQFYIWTDLVCEEAITTRQGDVVARRNPAKQRHLMEEDLSKRFK